MNRPPTSPATWELSLASVQGTSHASSGIPCQDAASCCVPMENRVRTLVALSDGAGSAPRAEQGSAMAVEMILKLAASHRESLGHMADEDHSLPQVWLEAIRLELETQARVDMAHVEDYACTLLLAVLEGDKAFFWQVGDGAWVLRQDGEIKEATWPHIGQYHNETVFVTSSWAHKHLKTVYFDGGVEAVAGFTDGMENLLLDFQAKKPHAPFLKKLFDGSMNLESAALDDAVLGLLNSELINSRTDDDKTLVLACRHPAADSMPGPDPVFKLEP